MDATPPHRNGTVPVMTTQGDVKTIHASAKPDGRPTIDDLQGDNACAEIARSNWLKSAKAPKVKSAVVKEIWDALEKDKFDYRPLLILETLQILEKYLWPGFSEDASNHHVLLIAVILNVKRREDLPSWTHLTERPLEFSAFFRRILSMTVDLSLPMKIRTHLVSFMIAAFESLDNASVRKECAPLVSIGIWHNLHSEMVREEKFNNHLLLGKAWRAAEKKYNSADDAAKARLRFERSWLYTLLLDFVDKTYSDAGGDAGQDNLHYCERFLELLIDLQSQLPTRRYVNSLLFDLNILPSIKLSPMFERDDHALFQDMYELLKHYIYFPIDEHSGQQLTPNEYYDAHTAKLANLQRVAFQSFEDKLKVLMLSDYGTCGQRDDLESHLKPLDDQELPELCRALGFRTEYPSQSTLVRDRAFWLEVLMLTYEWRPTYQEILKETSILPTEKTLYKSAFLRNESYNGLRPLAIPKLNLQYLTIGDFLWRSFVLHRAETFYAIRKDVEEVIKRVKPKAQAGGQTRFTASSRMALPIPKPAIVNALPPKVGEFFPAKVEAEIVLDMSRLSPQILREWESLSPGDMVFLAAIHPHDENTGSSNGHSELGSADRIGLRHLRAAEIERILDDKGKPSRGQQQERADGEFRRSKQRRLLLKIDPVAYQRDNEQMDSSKASVYDSINLIIRRRGRENNFRSILESIRRLALSDVPAPSWFQEVFLGYGDPTSAVYRRLSNRLKSIDFRDTFLGWQHLVESIPGKTLEVGDEAEDTFGPPYVLEFSSLDSAPSTSRPLKRRRGDPDEAEAPAAESVKVSTYKPLNAGPYTTDTTKLNTIRFTPTQIEAITSGSQPGLTVIVGPPGTGKTDVATQIINNIYHNFPAQRTLLIARSNQALNQLFQKITALDIDERHLLRLGHGEEELETDVSYSKYGRVESFLERGAMYLAEVKRLSQSINAPGAHWNSCETADYFNSVYIKPLWTRYWDSIQRKDSIVEGIVESFPFHQYFANAPQPLFHPQASKEAVVDVVRGCYRHIEKIFTELEDIRPFEILRNSRDKANYLLVQEARIIAMTSTHAAMRRQEIADLGFHYDNVIMEEAAQITEIENFIPLALQKPVDGKLPLQRIVLCGDHLQNSPIVQNLAFRQYANLEQSLFLRLIRLGVPSITLDAQGRARPSLASLYQWRYPNLTSLPLVQTSPEFLVANAGFRFDYQFIDVPDFNGKGETEPSPHFIQNLGEAEYAVAIYQYMRLLGYPASKISILTTYAGQRALIRDVLAHRCKGNMERLFGMPRIVTTVDKYQGEQNDCELPFTKRHPYPMLTEANRCHSFSDPNPPTGLSA